jgi:hypothetical protein
VPILNGANTPAGILVDNIGNFQLKKKDKADKDKKKESKAKIAKLENKKIKAKQIVELAN